jgi:hypothetical protein
MMTGGRFERFPKERIIVIEINSSWMYEQKKNHQKGKNVFLFLLMHQWTAQHAAIPRVAN